MIEYQLYDIETGIYNTYNLRASHVGGSFRVNTSSGELFNLSLNGQTMLDTDPIVYSVGNSLSIYNSGYIYITGGKVYFDMPVSGQDRVFYHYRDTDENSIFVTGETHSVLTGSFYNEVSDISTYNLYLNGVKLTSGVSYEANASNGFTWIDSETSISGNLFAIPRNNNISNITGYYDVHYNYFLKGCNTLYVNGVRYPKDHYMECYSGLSYNKLTSGYQMIVEGLNNISVIKL